MTAHHSARGKAKSSAPETELIDIGEQARLSARRRERIMSFASPLGLLLIWEIAGRLGLIDVRFFPVPSSIIGVMSGMIMSGELIEHVLISLQRILIGFFCGSYSACHCTPSAKPGASAIRIASMVPSSATPSTTTRSPGSRMPWP